jgi:thiamine transporter
MQGIYPGPDGDARVLFYGGKNMTMNTNQKTRILAESAICVAAAVVLSLFTLFRMPLGGSVTPFATLPIIVIGLRHDTKWGVAGALTFSLTQLLLGVSNLAAVPVRTMLNLLLCAALDYIIAYTIIGFTGGIARRFHNRAIGLSVGIIITGLGRLACSFLSGVLIWGSFKPDDWSLAYYSLAYNATWCLPDVALTLVAALLLTRVRSFIIFPDEPTH